MLGQWIEIGLAYDDFWIRTPREIAFIVKARVRGRIQEINERRQVAHEAARLIAYAYHKPEEMPEYRALASEGERRVRAPEQGSEADLEYVRQWFIRQAKRSQGT